MTSWIRVVLSSITLISACALAVAQEQPASSGECVPGGEPIYHAEKDKIKPPKLETKQAEQSPPQIRGTALLELLVNSEGRLCEVHILKATDHDAAVQVAAYVAKHWKFKPAIHDGKPVAVFFRSNFSQLPVTAP
jgi:TonB family protein